MAFETPHVSPSIQAFNTLFMAAGIKSGADEKAGRLFLRRVSNKDAPQPVVELKVRKWSKIGVWLGFFGGKDLFDFQKNSTFLGAKLREALGSLDSLGENEKKELALSCFRYQKLLETYQQKKKTEGRGDIATRSVFQTVKSLFGIPGAGGPEIEFVTKFVDTREKDFKEFLKNDKEPSFWRNLWRSSEEQKRAETMRCEEQGKIIVPLLDLLQKREKIQQAAQEYKTKKEQFLKAGGDLQQIPVLSFQGDSVDAFLQEITKKTAELTESIQKLSGNQQKIEEFQRKIDGHTKALAVLVSHVDGLQVPEVLREFQEAAKSIRDEKEALLEELRTAQAQSFSIGEGSLERKLQEIVEKERLLTESMGKVEGFRKRQQDLLGRIEKLDRQQADHLQEMERKKAEIAGKKSSYDAAFSEASALLERSEQLQKLLGDTTKLPVLQKFEEKNISSMNLEELCGYFTSLELVEKQLQQTFKQLQEVFKQFEQRADVQIKEFEALRLKVHLKATDLESKLQCLKEKVHPFVLTEDEKAKELEATISSAGSELAELQKSIQGVLLEGDALAKLQTIEGKSLEKVLRDLGRLEEVEKQFDQRWQIFDLERQYKEDIDKGKALLIRIQEFYRAHKAVAGKFFSDWENFSEIHDKAFGEQKLIRSEGKIEEGKKFLKAYREQREKLKEELSFLIKTTEDKVHDRRELLQKQAKALLERAKKGHVSGNVIARLELLTRVRDEKTLEQDEAYIEQIPKKIQEEEERAKALQQQMVEVHERVFQWSLKHSSPDEKSVAKEVEGRIDEFFQRVSTEGVGVDREWESFQMKCLDASLNTKVERLRDRAKQIEGYKKQLMEVRHRRAQLEVLRPLSLGREIVFEGPIGGYNQLCNSLEEMEKALQAALREEDLEQVVLPDISVSEQGFEEKSFIHAAWPAWQEQLEKLDEKAQKLGIKILAFSISEEEFQKKTWREKRIYFAEIDRLKNLLSDKDLHQLLFFLQKELVFRKDRVSYENYLLLELVADPPPLLSGRFSVPAPYDANFVSISKYLIGSEALSYWKTLDSKMDLEKKLTNTKKHLLEQTQKFHHEADGIRREFGERKQLADAPLSRCSWMKQQFPLAVLSKGEQGFKEFRETEALKKQAVEEISRIEEKIKALQSDVSLSKYFDKDYAPVYDSDKSAIQEAREGTALYREQLENLSKQLEEVFKKFQSVSKRTS